jgi:thiamine-monophosphate kinase
LIDLSEQEIIDKYFSRHQSDHETVDQSVGDDAAVVKPPKDTKLVITTDTLNVNVHFFEDCKAEYVGFKSLSVSLSDIAAMGACPLWATLSLSLPDVNHKWLENFSAGLYELADLHQVKLVGGDLVKGPLSITIQVIGYLYSKQSILRSTCNVDDLIYVTGNLGDAAFGLKILTNKNMQISQKEQDFFLDKLYKPFPRLDASKLISNYANAAIDISDGFLIDLNRVLSSSNKGAEINLDNMPISEQLQYHLDTNFSLAEILTGGEDYQIIFTINSMQKNKMEKEFNANNIKISEIGKIVKQQEIKLFKNGAPMELPINLGFDHFSK